MKLNDILLVKTVGYLFKHLPFQPRFTQPLANVDLDFPLRHSAEHAMSQSEQERNL